jgi:hypothetical protein
MVTIKSCNGVTVKKLNRMLAAPIYFKTLEACLEGIFFDELIKKIPKPTEWIAIPMSAQILEGFSEPFIPFAANKLLIKFFDQSNPVEFLSSNEPPG